MTSEATLEPTAREQTPAAFPELLSDFRRRLERRLEAWLAEKSAAWTGEEAEVAELTGELAPFVLRGGKRLRPAVLYHAFRGVGGDDDEAVMPACLSVELLHTYLLIHDDIMDRAETRRGAPAAHAVFREQHRRRGWRGDAEHHGASVAILLGDLAHSAAVELFGRCRAAPEALARARRIFDEMSQEVIAGQYLEMTAGQRPELGEEDLLQVLRMKSGRYSVERPIQLGALLAGRQPDEIESFARFGRAMGEAFQLQDDLLGVFGELDAVGKPVGSDLVEGKRTVLVLHTLARATDAERRRVEAALGRADLGAEEIAAVCGIIRSTGAEATVREMITARLGTARGALVKIELTDEGRVFFEGLTDYLEVRDR